MKLSRLFKRGGETRSMDWWGHDAPPPGQPVTQERAVHLAAVYAAIRHIVGFISTLPIDEYRVNSDGTQTEIPLSGPFRTADLPGRPGVRAWIAQCVFGLVVHGNSVGWTIESDGYGFPTNVDWLKRQDWSFDEQSKEWRVYGQVVPPSRLVHVPSIVIPTGCTLGLSPLETALRDHVRSGISAQEYSDVRRGGGLPPAHLKNSAVTLNARQSTDTQARAMASFASGRPFVTGKDWDLSLLTIPPNQLQFLETLKLGATQIAAIYGIDPREIGGEAAQSLTYVNEESRDRRRVANLRDYLVLLELAFARILPGGARIKFNVDSTVRTDISTRIDIIGAQIADGRLSVNEARELEDRPPVPGGDYHNIPTPGNPPQPPKKQPGSGNPIPAAPSLNGAHHG